MRIFLEKPYLLALLLSVGITTWLLSGQSQEHLPEKPPSVQPSSPVISVSVREQQAQPLTREIIITGQTAPLRTVTLRSEISSRIIAVEVPRGARVHSGQTLIRLAVEDRELRLNETRALVKQKELEYEAAQNLQKKGFQSQTQIAEAWSALEGAKTQFEQAKIALENTEVHAPFAGVLVQRPVEEGDYLMQGSVIAELMEEDPFLVIGEVTELQRQQLKVGDLATASLVTGQQVKGKISLIAARADPATRTFRIEVDIPNPTGQLVAGVTCEIHIPLAPVLAHNISSALLSLNDEGILGVKTVSSDNHVAFHPIELSQATSKGIWLTGLPQTLRFITVGQGFVRPGDLVHPVLEKDGEKK